MQSQVITDMSATPFVSIVVPTFQRPDVLAETLAALLKQAYPKESFEIIVVDDGSGDRTPEVVASMPQTSPRLHYHVQTNSGVATARNQGARLARGEVLIFVDDDIIVPPEMIKQHLGTMARFGDCLVNGHWEFTPQLKTALETTPFGRFRIEVEIWVKKGLAKSSIGEGYLEPAGVTACNLGIRRDNFWRIGGFDEQFPFAGYEDQEFSIRAAAAGYRFIYNQGLQLLHNDHRLTLTQFCERQRRGAITAALLALKYPEKLEMPLIRENYWLSSSDAPTVLLKKISKSVLSYAPVLSFLRKVTSMAEITKLPQKYLNKLYWILCGLYLFLGIREGLSTYQEAAIAATVVRTAE